MQRWNQYLWSSFLSAEVVVRFVRSMKDDCVITGTGFEGEGSGVVSYFMQMCAVIPVMGSGPAIFVLNLVLRGGEVIMRDLSRRLSSCGASCVAVGEVDGFMIGEDEDQRLGLEGF